MLGPVSDTASDHQVMFERSALEKELLGRVAWLVRLRWMLAVLVFVITAVAATWFGIELHWVEIFAVGAAILAYNIVLAYRLGKLRRDPSVGIKTFRRFAGVQIVLDWLALIILIYFTGGIESPLVFLLHFQCGRRQYVVSVADCFCLCGSWYRARRRFGAHRVLYAAAPGYHP